MKISVIIPVLNEAQRLRNTILSTQLAKADEVIVVDGGSDDGSMEIAKELNCIVLNSELGRGPQQNEGAKVATGDILLFLHADCCLSIDSLKQLRALDPKPMLCGCFRQQILANGSVYRLIEKGNELRVRLRGLYYGDQAIFITRELFEQVNGFPNEPLMEDLLLAQKTKKLTKPKLLPGPVSVDARRWQQNGPIRQTIRNWILVTRLYLGASPGQLVKEYHK